MDRFEEILRILGREKNWPLEKTESGEWKITVPRMEGGSQTVYATPRVDREQDALVHIWSVIGTRSDLKDPLALLELNAKLSYGACAVDAGNVILKHSHLVKDADVTELGKSINYIGNKAPQLRKEFLK
ncbi:MAG: type III secretion system chaperone family protein [Planctomycetota bacterium]